MRFRYKVESADSAGSLAVLEVEIPAHTLVKPHTHSREDEFSLVVDGTVGARIGDRELTAGPGCYLVKPRGTAHAMWNAASTPATVIRDPVPRGHGSLFRAARPDPGRPSAAAGVLPAGRRVRPDHPGRLDRRTWSAATR